MQGDLSRYGNLGHPLTLATTMDQMPQFRVKRSEKGPWPVVGFARQEQTVKPRIVRWAEPHITSTVIRRLNHLISSSLNLKGLGLSHGHSNINAWYCTVCASLRQRTAKRVAFLSWVGWGNQVGNREPSFDSHRVVFSTYCPNYIVDVNHIWLINCAPAMGGVFSTHVPAEGGLSQPISSDSPHSQLRAAITRIHFVTSWTHRSIYTS